MSALLLATVHHPVPPALLYLACATTLGVLFSIFLRQVTIASLCASLVMCATFVFFLPDLSGSFRAYAQDMIYEPLFRDHLMRHTGEGLLSALFHVGVPWTLVALWTRWRRRSEPRRQPGLKHWLLAAALIGGTIPAAAQLTMRTSNCGGNSAALNEVRTFNVLIDLASTTSGHAFTPGSVTAEERRTLDSMVANPWVAPARILIAAPPFRGGPRRVIVVCDQPFTNVPARVFRREPPTHAAGFSDGTTGLISTREFAALDRTAFVPLEELLARAATASAAAPP